MTSSQRFINKAKKEALRNFDAVKLDYIQEHSKLRWLAGESIFDEKFETKNHFRMPDLLTPGFPEIILEHDTVKLHSELGMENERTVRRNQDYVRTKRPFFVINEDLAKHLKLDEANLATYMYYFILSQVKAGLWNK